jgi:hypothetical protein
MTKFNKGHVRRLRAQVSNPQVTAVFQSLSPKFGSLLFAPNPESVDCAAVRQSRGTSIRWIVRIFFSCADFPLHLSPCFPPPNGFFCDQISCQILPHLLPKCCVQETNSSSAACKHAPMMSSSAPHYSPLFHQTFHFALPLWCTMRRQRLEFVLDDN